MAKKLFSSIVALTLVLSAAGPAFATTGSDTQVGNVGNGVDSTNTTSVNQSNTTTVSQSNNATINNNISVKSNTGGNDANRNTGGDVAIDTGDSKTTVVVENVANRNAAQVDTCCQANGDVTVLNEGNGDSSYNKAKVNAENSTGLFQNNNAAFNNNVAVTSNTGKNDANRNTGGDVFVGTGTSDVGVGISNTANENRALLGGGGAGHAGDLTLANRGNGVDTYNKVSANFTNSTLALQGNNAAINNSLDIYTNTGKNDANRNTGGDVVVDTGASDVTALLDNRANFNAASLDNCGCVGFGGDTKVVNVGNGDSASSKAYLTRDNLSEVFQNNNSAINNYGSIYDNTGKNDANRNTGAYGEYSDPAVYTGDSDVTVSAESTANENLLNSGAVSFPNPPTTGGNTSGNGNWWSMWGSWSYWM